MNAAESAGVNTTAVIDLTPPEVGNWLPSFRPLRPVLIVNPHATLHEKTALAWSLAADAVEIADGQVPGVLPQAIVGRLHQLEALLEEVARVTGRMEGESSQ